METNNYLIKKYNTLNIAASSIAILGGVLLLANSHKLPESLDDFKPFITVVCGILILGGAIRFFMNMKKEVYITTGKDVVKKMFFFNNVDSGNIIHAIEQRNFTGLEREQKVNSSGLQMRMVYSIDHQYIQFQLFKYASYNYAPVSEEYHFFEKEAKSFIAALNQNNIK